jgi:hypothetical protein
MKIKISKSQWEDAGRKAGWVKTAQTDQAEQLENKKSIPPVNFPDFDLYGLESGKANVSIDRYPNSRFWQVTVNGQLLAVVVYRKGAQSIKEVIEKLANNKGAI